MRRSPTRKGTKGRLRRREEGSLVQTEEPVFAPRAARRVRTSPRSITFAYVTSTSSSLLLPSLLPPFTSSWWLSCLSCVPPPFPYVVLLCSLTSHGTQPRADNEASPLTEAITQAPLARSGTARRRVRCRTGEIETLCESVLEKLCARLRGRKRAFDESLLLLLLLRELTRVSRRLSRRVDLVDRR